MTQERQNNMKVQVRFDQEELTLAITRHLEAEGYTVKAVHFSYDRGSQLEPGSGVSCEADVERGPRHAGLTLSHSHIPGARAFTAETSDQE